MKENIQKPTFTFEERIQILLSVMDKDWRPLGSVLDQLYQKDKRYESLRVNYKERFMKDFEYVIKNGLVQQREVLNLENNFVYEFRINENPEINSDPIIPNTPNGNNIVPFSRKTASASKQKINYTPHTQNFGF